MFRCKDCVFGIQKLHIQDLGWDDGESVNERNEVREGFSIRLVYM